MSGITWHSRMPTSPTIGDCYFDTSDGNGYMWQGTSWVAFLGKYYPEPPFMPPTPEQLEMHPSLKIAWEEFLVIKKILGV